MYDVGESHSDFNNDTGYTPVFAVDLESVPESVKETCGNNTECIYDYSLTGSMEFAMSTVIEVEEQKKVRKTQSKLMSQEVFGRRCVCNPIVWITVTLVRASV